MTELTPEAKAELEAKAEAEAKADQKPPEANGAVAHYKQQLEAGNATIAELKANNEKLAKSIEEKENEQLTSQNNFKQLYENGLLKIKTLEESGQEKDKNISTYVKMSEIKKEAAKAGIIPSAIDDLDFIDKSMVTVETTSSGNIAVHGAKELIQSIKETRSHWFKDGVAPIVNNGDPIINTGKELTAKEIIALEKKDPTKYNEIMKKRLTIV